MSSASRFARIVTVVTRRPLIVLALTAALALAGAALALRLEPSAATDTLVDSDSQTFRDTDAFKRDFGDEAVVVLVRGDLGNTLLTEDLGRVLRLEGCLSGNVPDNKKGLGDLPPVCREIARLKPAKVVFGPGTFLNTAVNGIAREFSRRQTAAEAQAAQAAQAAGRLSARRGDSPAEQQRLAGAASDAVMAQFTQYVIQLGLKYGITDLPRLDDPNFVSAIAFDTDAGDAGVPKSRFAYLFPSRNAAMITIRLKADLSDAQRRKAIDLFTTAVGRPAFKPTHGQRYIVTGVPVVAEGLADAVQSAIFVLLGAALLVMAATLALVFRTRLRLLPLVLALAASAVTFGALSLAGGSLTMASIAVLPVLIGLAVDYSIQFQARFDEARARGGDPRSAAAAAAAAGGPTILTAGVATAVGFLVLLLSPIPMVRGFGALLVLGIAVALACAVCAGFAALTRFGGGAVAAAPRRSGAPGAHTRAWPTPASGSRTAPGERSASRCRTRGGCSASRSRWRWSGSRPTPRARSSRTCASSCPPTWTRFAT